MYQFEFDTLSKKTQKTQNQTNPITSTLLFSLLSLRDIHFLKRKLMQIKNPQIYAELVPDV